MLVLWTMPQQAILWRADVIRAIGGWNENVLEEEDWELLLRASRVGAIVFVPGTVVSIRLHGGHSTPWTKAETRRAEQQWIREHVASLPAGERSLGKRLAAARWLWRSGRAAYGGLDASRALSLYTKAMRLAPILLTSRLLRPTTTRDVAKALVGALMGNRGILAFRQAKKTVQAIRETRRPKPIHPSS